MDTALQKDPKCQSTFLTGLPVNIFSTYNILYSILAFRRSSTSFSNKANVAVLPFVTSLLKVAWSGFWVTIPFNFDQLLQHHQESDRKSIFITELEKDQSFRCDKFCLNWSYRGNGMTSYPIYIIPNNSASRENFGKRFFTDLLADILVLRSDKILRILKKAFSAKFSGVKIQEKDNNSKNFIEIYVHIA